ncbi:protocadherin Fat 4 isoform X1 [Gadus morhua]|uniref:protocadherin Fat 4 isoform X1 n=1 Tax=Gadus morhua TaxID=8049 RepID=UPI0011B587AD|nr:protocadherin Fat 4-like isoform X1 [Gadus morhua]XP_030207360.1 protocadherin Fat 4-like isoform X1 [Gadus morhua]
MEQLWLCVLMLSVGVTVVQGIPGTSTINCATPSDVDLGNVDEGYEGRVEQVTGITAGSHVLLVANVFPEHLDFLELVFLPGETTANVITRKKLDADVLVETGGQLRYSLVCNDLDKFENKRTLKINDLNDNTPAFTKELYEITVSEILPVDTEVLRVQAIDLDISLDNKRLSFSMLPPSLDFQMLESGALIVTRRLNYNSQQLYSFSVKAKDVGGLFDEAMVVIKMEDIDNLNPYFKHNLYRASIPENESGPFHRITPEAIWAQDGDTGINEAIVYRITEVSPPKYAERFTMDSSSGVVVMISAIDREELDGALITVSIEAAQADDPSKAADSLVIVTIEDVNDNTPVFSQQSVSVSILENSPVGVVVAMASVADADQGGFVGNLSIIPDSAPFSVSADGSVRVKDSAALDRESHTSFLFQVTAIESDPPNRVARMSVEVILVDQNDNSPNFTQGLYVVRVDGEQKEGMLLVWVKAEDPDEGENGEITYSLDFGNKDGYFSINEKSGEITLKKMIPPMLDIILEFSLFVTARDGGIVSRSSSAQVNIFGPGVSKPQFTQKTYSGTIEEEKNAGVEILKVTFLTLGSEVPPTLQVVTEKDKFAISSDGIFTSTITLDYDESPQNYSVSISISDGVDTDHAVVEVQVTDVNDNSPEFGSGPFAISVPEDTAVGDNVTVLPARDKDYGFNGDLRYSLEGGKGKFSIDPKSGIVRVAAPLDRESDPGFSLLVVAQDQGQPARSASVPLKVLVADINDNVPEFSRTEFYVDVKENASVGIVLLTLSAADPDEGPNGTVTYSIRTQSPSSTPAAFELDSSTGALRLALTLDFSVAQMYRLTVGAVDGGVPALVGNSTVVIRVVDVNNHPPQFIPDRFHVQVPENLRSGTVVCSLDVTDKDEDGFSNGHFILTSDTFDIDQKGVVFLRDNATLDRETCSSYLLQIVAVDQPTSGLSSTAEINLEVLDYNDNSPQFGAFPDPLLVSEGHYSDSAPGEVHTFLVTDEDAGPNKDITLSFPSPNPLFTLREDGTLLVVGPLDRETRDSYDIVILASDQGTPQRENFTTVRLNVADVNDNMPQFGAERYSKSLLVKDAKKGDLVLRLTATDHDAGNNSLITYSFSAGGHPFLSINSETGAVVLTSDLASVTKDTTITLTAIARDQGQPPLSSTAVVVINLRMSSLVEELSFESSSYNFTLAENRPEGTIVGLVNAFPGNDINTVNYTLVGHTDMFSINAHGAITANKALDKESQEWYILEVEAFDNRVPPTSATAMVSVQVVDVNEDPEFVRDNYTARIFSIAFYKSPVVYVQATDPDLGDQGKLYYSIPLASPYFEVDGSSGLLYVVSAEALAGQSAMVEVRATDPGGLYVTTMVKVEVQGSFSSNVVVISLNQAANVVENKIPEVESALGRVIGWTVDVIGVSNTNGGASISRTSRQEPKTYVSFIAMAGVEVILSEDVKSILRMESDALKKELEKVFGKGLQYAVEEEESVPTSDVAVIALAVLLAISMLVLMLIVALSVVKFRTMKKHLLDPHREKFDIDRHSEGFTNTARKTSVTFAPDQASVGRTSLKQDQRSWQEGLEGQTGPEEGSTRGEGWETRRSRSETTETGGDREAGSREAEGGAERNRGGASTGHLDEDIEGSVKDWDVSTSAL